MNTLGYTLPAPQDPNRSQTNPWAAAVLRAGVTELHSHTLLSTRSGKNLRKALGLFPRRERKQPVSRGDLGALSPITAIIPPGWSSPAASRGRETAGGTAKPTRSSAGGAAQVLYPVPTAPWMSGSPNNVLPRVQTHFGMSVSPSLQGRRILRAWVLQGGDGMGLMDHLQSPFPSSSVFSCMGNAPPSSSCL